MSYVGNFRKFVLTQVGRNVRWMLDFFAGEPNETDVGQNLPAFANDVTAATSGPASTTVTEQFRPPRRFSAKAAVVPAKPAPITRIFFFRGRLSFVFEWFSMDVEVGRVRKRRLL